MVAVMGYLVGGAMLAGFAREAELVAGDVLRELRSGGGRVHSGWSGRWIRGGGLTKAPMACFLRDRWTQDSLISLLLPLGMKEG